MTTTAALIRRWQERLRIKDWTITYEILPGPEMDVGCSDGEELLGLCFRDADDRTAHIRLRRGLKEKREPTIIHELLHVLDCEEDEVRINKLARALTHYRP